MCFGGQTRLVRTGTGARAEKKEYSVELSLSAASRNDGVLLVRSILATMGKEAVGENWNAWLSQTPDWAYIGLVANQRIDLGYPAKDQRERMSDGRATGFFAPVGLDLLNEEAEKGYLRALIKRYQLALVKRVGHGHSQARFWYTTISRFDGHRSPPSPNEPSFMLGSAIPFLASPW